MLWSRRWFLRIVGGLLAGLGGGASDAARTGQPRSRLLAIHDKTRNTRPRMAGALLRSLIEDPPRQKHYPGERFDLSTQALGDELALDAAARGYSPAPTFTGEPIALPQLVRLLHLTNGVTGRFGSGRSEVMLRAAPSAGALYAGEVYVVAERILGLERGVYYFSPLGARLVALRRGPALDALDRALEEPGRVTGAAAVVLLTNVFHRYRSRYGARGYRYALIDSGHIGENLRLAAAARGLSDWSPLRFCDDGLHALLPIDGVDEAVCAVHAIGRPGPRHAPGGGTLRFAERGQAASPLTGARDSVEHYHEATKLVPAKTRPDRERVFDPVPRERPDEGGGTLALPQRRSVPALPTGEAIERRRSANAFGTQSVTLEELAFVLETADGHAPLRRASSVELHVAAHRIAGVPPGLYRYASETRELQLRRPGGLPGRLVDACLGQDMAGSAAAALLMVGRLREAEARGDRSYRDLLIEAGAMGQRIYLSAESLGLAARNLAAFVDDDLNSLLRLSLPDRAVLHLTLLGHDDED